MTSIMKTKHFWLLAALTFLLLFLFMGQTPFHTKGEPREAVVALSMLQQDNWILPINNGVDMAYKPPFFHWCIAAASMVAGEVNEYTSRLPSAFWLAVMVLTGYIFYARRRGVELAFLMALLTLTNFEVHRAGVNCRVDMVLSALMVLSIYQLYKWGERDMKGIPWTAILCMSGAILTKGPVGMVLPCLVVGVFLWIRTGRFGRVFGKFVAVGLGACLLPLLWYVAAWRQGGDEFLTLVLEENVLRFLGKMTYESHENPWYYNVMTVLAGYVPYTLLVLLSLFVLKYKKPDWNLRAAHLSVHRLLPGGIYPLPVPPPRGSNADLWTHPGRTDHRTAGFVYRPATGTGARLHLRQWPACGPKHRLHARIGEPSHRPFGAGVAGLARRKRRLVLPQPEAGHPGAAI